MNHPLLEANLNFDEYLIKAGRRPLSSSGRGIKECDSSEQDRNVDLADRHRNKFLLLYCMRNWMSITVSNRSRKSMREEHSKRSSMIQNLVKNLAAPSGEAATSSRMNNVTNASSNSKSKKPFRTAVSSNGVKEIRSQKESMKNSPSKIMSAAYEKSESKWDQGSRRSVTRDMDAKKSDSEARSPAVNHTNDEGSGQNGNQFEGRTDDRKVMPHRQDDQNVPGMMIHINTCEDECAEYEDDFESSDGEDSPEPCRHLPPPYQPRSFLSKPDTQPPYAPVRASTVVERGAVSARKSGGSGSMPIASLGDMSAPAGDMSRSRGSPRGCAEDNGNKNRSRSGSGSGSGNRSYQESLSNKSLRSPSPSPSKAVRRPSIITSGIAGTGSEGRIPSAVHTRKSSGVMMRSQSACTAARRRDDANHATATPASQSIRKSASTKSCSNGVSQRSDRGTDTGPGVPVSSSALTEQRRALEQRAADRRQRVLGLHRQAEERVSSKVGEREQQQILQGMEEDKALEILRSQRRLEVAQLKVRALPSAEERAVQCVKVRRVEVFRRNTLLLKGLSPWIRLINRARMDYVRAVTFSHLQVMIRTWQALKGYADMCKLQRIRADYRKTSIAVSSYRHGLCARAFKRWSSLKKVLRAKAVAVSGHFTRHIVCARSFTAWRIALERNERMKFKQMQAAAFRANAVLLRASWKQWQQHVHEEILEREVRTRAAASWQRVKGWMSDRVS